MKSELEKTHSDFANLQHELNKQAKLREEELK